VRCSILHTNVSYKLMLNLNTHMKTSYYKRWRYRHLVNKTRFAAVSAQGERVAASRRGKSVRSSILLYTHTYTNTNTNTNKYPPNLNHHLVSRRGLAVLSEQDERVAASTRRKSVRCSILLYTYTYTYNTTYDESESSPRE